MGLGTLGTGFGRLSLLSRGGIGLLPETKALIARFTTPPTYERKVLINNCIAALIDAGVWAKLDAFYVLAAADAQAARQNWIADAYNLTAVNSPTFTIDRGYAGNGSTSYLRTNFNPTTAAAPKFVRNSAHASLVDRTSRAAADSLEFGAYGASGPFTAEIATRFTGDLGLLRVTGAVTAIPSVASTESSGRFVVSRTGATALEFYRDAASIGTSANGSAAPQNLEFYIGAANRTGAAALYSTDQIAQVGFGGALSGAEVTAMDAAIATYLAAVGA